LSELLIDPRNRILRHPETVAAIRRGERVWPLHVEMDLSNRCNLKCYWCDFAYVHDGEVMDQDLAAHILVQLAEGGTKAVTFTGGGEPTVCPHFALTAQVARGQGLDVALYTNGVNLSPVREVLECLSWVYVSLDAPDPETYETVKGARAFQTVCGNVKELVQRRGDRQLPKIGVGFLLTGTTWQDVEWMVHLSRELGADYCQFRPAVGLNDYTWVPDALRTLERFTGPTVYASRERFREMLGFSRSYDTCRGSEVVPCIGAGGELWACVNTRGLRSLGSLKTESFRDLWQRRPVQLVGKDCRRSCRNHYLNETLEYVCSWGLHDNFV
jgi:MoaA/NifB/PqqE/SkfB family radical SAM enzyme